MLYYSCSNGHFHSCWFFFFFNSFFFFPLISFFSFISFISSPPLNFFFPPLSTATFDYLPHTPKVVPITESRYHTTSLMVCHKILKPFFSAVLLYQNFHIMHHLYPTIPFYLYERAYLCKKDELDEKEIPVRRLPFHSYEEKAF